MLGKDTVKIWRTEPVAAGAESSSALAANLPPGTIVEASARGLIVACGEGALRIAELQPAGSRRMDAAAFTAGRRNLVGARFGASPP
jgi:methionyl-tRNA formyltransferase